MSIFAARLHDIERKHGVMKTFSFMFNADDNV